MPRPRSAAAEQGPGCRSRAPGWRRRRGPGRSPSSPAFGRVWRGRRPVHRPSAAAMLAGVPITDRGGGSPSLTAGRSLSPLPVRTQTARAPRATAPSATALRSTARDAAEAGSQKMPSTAARSRCAAPISASVTESIRPSDSSRAATAPAQDAGLPIRIAVAIVQALAETGTRVLFGVPGGGPNLDVVGAASAVGLRFVLARGETAAVIMAATCADLTGTPGAVLVTRGPGLASAVNGIAHAALDLLPVVVIADTVAAADAGRISHQRLDQAALGRSVAKAVATVGGSRAGAAAAQLIRLALEPPPGPVIANMDDSVPGSDGLTACPGAGTAAGGAAGTGVAPLAGALRAARRAVVLLGTGAIPRTAPTRCPRAGSGPPATHTSRPRASAPASAPEAAG